MSESTPEIVVIVEPQVTEVTVALEAPTVVQVDVSEVGMPGPRGPEGPQGPPGESSDVLLESHINSETPHPVYDDGPSLLLLYENAKVG